MVFNTHANLPHSRSTPTRQRLVKSDGFVNVITRAAERAFVTGMQREGMARLREIKTAPVSTAPVVALSQRTEHRLAKQPSARTD